MNDRQWTLPATVLTVALLTACGGSTPTNGGPTADGGGDEHAAHESERTGDGQASVDHSGEDAARTVHLSADQRAALGIRIGEARSGDVAATVSAPATVHFDGDRIAAVGPRLDSKVLRIERDLGERVAVGDVIAVLDSVALGQARAKYRGARSRLETARAAYQREQRLAERQIASEAEVLDAKAQFEGAQADFEAAQAALELYGFKPGEGSDDAPLSRYLLRSPIDGVLDARDVVPGDTVAPNETPFEVVQTGTLWVFADVAEADAARVSVGQAATFRPRALPERRFSAKVGWIARQLDTQTRTVRVRMTIENPGAALRAGMFGRLKIDTGARARSVLVPADAVQRLDGEPVVFVPGQSEGEFVARHVRTGPERDGSIAIESGLAAGARIATTGTFDLMSALTASGRSASHGH